MVGKLLRDILDDVEPGAAKEGCQRIVARLLRDRRVPEAGALAPSREESAQQQRRSQALERLKEDFFHLAVERNRSRAGMTLEKPLNRLFEIFDLQPRQPFRVVGEQIDGSFLFDSDVYLMESKWEKDPLPEADLLVFRGKIEGKSTFTRGVFIALNDISIPARDAITRGRRPPPFSWLTGMIY